MTESVELERHHVKGEAGWTVQFLAMSMNSIQTASQLMALLRMSIESEGHFLRRYESQFVDIENGLDAAHGEMHAIFESYIQNNKPTRQ